MFRRVREAMRTKLAERTREESAARESAAKLAAQPPRRQELLIRNSRRYRSCGLYRRLREHCLAARHSDLKEMLRLARLALQVADEADSKLYGAVVSADLRAEARGELADALRLADDLVGAEAMFREAFAWQSQGSSDPMLLARLWMLRARLSTDRRDLAAGQKQLDAAFGLYSAVGETHLAGRILIAKGTYYGAAAEPRKAFGLIERGLGLIDRNAEPSLVAIALHNLAFYAAEDRQIEHACRLYRESQPLFDRHFSPLNKLRTRWLEAKIAAGSGLSEAAERAFMAARVGFLAREMGYDAALVSLEMAALLLPQGRVLETRLLVEEAVRTFRALEIHREALAALLLLRRSFEAQEVSLAYLLEITAFVKRTRIDARAKRPFAAA